jgi:hypothetical protein
VRNNCVSQDVQVGFTISELTAPTDTSLAAQFPLPSVPQSRWLSVSPNGPRYGGQLGCSRDVNQLCAGVLLVNVQDGVQCGQLSASTYCLTVQPVQAMTYSLISTYLGILRISI